MCPIRCQRRCVKLFLWRNKNAVKLSTNQESINAQFEMLENTIHIISNHLDATEEQQKNAESSPIDNS
jgi:hypothetical protein